MKRFSRRLAGLAGVTMMSIAMLGFSTAQAAAQEAAPADGVGVQSSCNHSWSIKDGRTGWTVANGVNIRSGPHDYSPACTVVGQAQMSHSLRFDCYVYGTGGTWSHIYDYNTGVSGWIRDDLLSAPGAFGLC